MYRPTGEQQAVLDETSSCVVIAQPGSGKTTTLSVKIKQILNNLPHYKGVIAISYTNKASDELKVRTLQGGLDIKGSFFGTMDKFYISQVVIPFGRHVFGRPVQGTVQIVSVREFVFEGNEDFRKNVEGIIQRGITQVKQDDINILHNLYIDGTVLLETVPILAIYIFQRSIACRRYIEARFSHVIIDEYQDCGHEQHEMFLHLYNLGLTCIAVGDLNQSIFGFSNKSSAHLNSLTSHLGFVVHRLTLNHRCDPSIINYSSRLLSTSIPLLPVTNLNVFHKSVRGNEVDIAAWIDTAIPFFCHRYNIDNLNKVAILVRGSRTGTYMDNNLSTPHKYFVNGPLDEDSSVWGTIFKKTLRILFDNSTHAFDMLEEYLTMDTQPHEAREVMELLSVLATICAPELQRHLSSFISIAKILFPYGSSQTAVNSLQRVLSTPVLIELYKPARAEEANIMTLHKSKGLEFDFVFHLDMYKYILPNPREDLIQHLNLHYVGVTRAKKGCVLCTSSKRHNAERELDAEPTEFFTRHGVNSLRVPCPV